MQDLGSFRLSPDVSSGLMSLRGPTSAIQRSPGLSQFRVLTYSGSVPICAKKLSLIREEQAQRESRPRAAPTGVTTCAASGFSHSSLTWH